MNTGINVTGAVKESTTIPNFKPFVGLCITCNNAEFCVYRKLRGSDAICCEMFDNYTPSDDNSSKTSLEQKTTRPISSEQEDFKGLCVNCAHRDVCGFPRLSSGVWHCEEYA